MNISRKDISYGIVAFIDMLGFSDQVGISKSLGDVKKIIQQVQALRSEFQEVTELRELAKKEVIAFTDCMIISVAAKSKVAQLQGTYDTWMVELLLIALSQYKCVMTTNIFIRGGMSDGWWYHKDNVLISPAQAEAYKLESQKAKYPIIVLSNHLAGYFTNPDNYEAYSYNPTERLLLKDEERDIWFVDYLGCGIEELGWKGNKDIEKKHRRCHDDDEKRKLRTQGWKLKAKAAFQRHKEAILDAYNSSSSNNIKKKYRWLAKYHNSVIERYDNHFEKLKVNNIK